MSASSSSWNVRNLLQLIYRYRFRSTNATVRYSSGPALANKIEHGYQGLHNDNLDLDTSMVKVNDNKVKSPPIPEPPRPNNFPEWAKWLLGTVLPVILPFLSKKWLALKKIEEEVEIGIKEAETVAGVVEKVATTAENVSAQMAQKLPENGKFKEAALLIQHVSKTTAHDAHLTNTFIHKVDDVVHDVEDLETMVEPVVKMLFKATQVK